MTQHLLTSSAGVAAFALAHVMYILAFGFNPLRPVLYLKLLPVSALVYWYIYTGLNGVALKLSVLIYCLIILFMNWRALAKIK